jgi:3-dehydroquinate dehydratase
MRILVLHGPSDSPESNDRLEAAAKQLGVELAISRAGDEPGLRAALEEHIASVQGVLIGPALCRETRLLHGALKAIRVPVVEVLRSRPAYTVALRSMVEMLRHPDA